MTTNSTIVPAAADDTQIHSRAVLVWLNISTWTARKYDKAATAKIVSHYNASGDAARVNKSLLPSDATSYKALTQLATAIRAQHYEKTLAWSDEGWRLLPTANYQEYATWYRKAAAEFAAALDAFSADYPQLRSEAAVRLNGMYRSEDYPALQDVRQRFTVGVQFGPVPAAGDIRVDLGAEQRATIEQSITDRVQAATAIAMNDAWTRLHDVVAHIAERLQDPKAIFRDSLISNAKEVCDALSRLNVTNDPNLEAMRARVAAELTAIDPATLREAPIARLQTADKAAAIMSAMSGLYGGTR